MEDGDTGGMNDSDVLEDDIHSVFTCTSMVNVETSLEHDGGSH